MNKYGTPAANHPAELAHQGHRHPLQDHLGGGEEHEVLVGQVGIVSVGAHVGGQVGVDVWIAEVRVLLVSTFTGHEWVK